MDNSPELEFTVAPLFWPLAATASGGGLIPNEIDRTGAEEALSP
jgi:hypothetical protein